MMLALFVVKSEKELEGCSSLPLFVGSEILKWMSWYGYRLTEKEEPDGMIASKVR
jgi:hypothetical protein